MRAYVNGINLILGMLLLAAAPAGRCGAQGGQGSLGGRVGAVREGDAVSYQHIMTPGDRGEWPLTARAGETIIVFVTSTSFDPAVQVVDAAGKVLAENDDIRPGLQDSLVLYRFPAAGEYKILVKGFKSAAGGQYTLSLRRFTSMDVRKAERNVGVLGKSRAKWSRFAANAGETLVVTSRSAVFDPEMEVYGPNGERVDAQARAWNGGRTVSLVFRAPAKGDYYLRVASNRENAGGYAVTVATARVSPLTIGVANPARRLDAGGLDLWTFQGTAADVIHVAARAAGTGAAVSMRYLPAAAKTETQGNPGGVEDAFAVLPASPKVAGEMLALVRRAGTFQVEVSQPLGMEMEYSLSTARAVKRWTAGAEPAGTLSIGGSDYWAIDGKAGEIVKTAGTAVPFDIVLELYNPQGEPVESNDDGGGAHNAILTALLKETGRYLLRVHAFGDGGSGPYQLQRKPNPVHSLKMGARSEGTVGTGSSDIWSFQGKAGQTVILSVRSHDFDTRVSVFGPDAIEVANDENGRDGTDSLLSIRLPVSGAYTVWVSSRSAGGKYIVRLVDGD